MGFGSGGCGLGRAGRLGWCEQRGGGFSAGLGGAFGAGDVEEGGGCGDSGLGPDDGFACSGDGFDRSELGLGFGAIEPSLEIGDGEMMEGGELAEADRAVEEVFEEGWRWIGLGAMADRPVGWQVG